MGNSNIKRPSLDISSIPANDVVICLICNCNCNEMCHFNLPRCKHNFCAECLCTYLKDISSCKIVCPSPECNIFISDSIIRKCLSNEKLVEYERCCNPPNTTKCLIHDCPYTVVSEDNDGHFVCPNCKQPNCLKCSNLHIEEAPCGVSADKIIFEENGARNLRENIRLELIQYEKDNDFAYNPESSRCQNCDLFLPPRDGMRIIPCMHNFCGECLKRTTTMADNILRLTCLACDVPLDNRQCRELIGEEKLTTLSMKPFESQFFNCQTPDCPYSWDPGDYTGIHKCAVCHHDNCISCQAIHEGQCCTQYKESDRYRKCENEQKFLENMKSMKCYRCEYIIFIRKGGCNALECPQCMAQVCALTGLEVGPNGCKCTPSLPCHPDCIYGCIPE